VSIEIKPWWLTLGPRRLRPHLAKLNYTAPVIDDILRKVWRIKEEQRKAKLKRSSIFHLWDELLRPARIELGVVRTMKSQIRASEVVQGFIPDGTQAKLDALCRYEDVLALLVEKLRRVQRVDEQTPREFVQTLAKAGKRAIPNNGQHWTDYVSPDDKRRIERLFDALPPPQRGKKKVPFEYRISRQEHEKKRFDLIKQMADEQQRIDQEMEMARNSFDEDALKKRIDALQYAQYALDQKKLTDPLPLKWQSLS
jgi:hypothetical protein